MLRHLSTVHRQAYHHNTVHPSSHESFRFFWGGMSPWSRAGVQLFILPQEIFAVCVKLKLSSECATISVKFAKAQ